MKANGVMDAQSESGERILLIPTRENLEQLLYSCLGVILLQWGRGLLLSGVAHWWLKCNIIKPLITLQHPQGMEYLLQSRLFDFQR